MQQRTNEHGQPVGEPVQGWTSPPRPADDLVLDLPVGRPVRGRGRAHGIPRGHGGPGLAPLAICTTGERRVVGMAAYLRITRAAGSIEVGAIMLGPELARTRAATEAMWLMAGHAFGLGYRRYAWKCDSLNAPSRRAAERLGLRHEGTWRNALVYKGRNRDTAWYAMTDADWARLGPAIGSWLQETRGRRQTRPLGERTRPT